MERRSIVDGNFSFGGDTKRDSGETLFIGRYVWHVEDKIQVLALVVAGGRFTGPKR